MTVSELVREYRINQPNGHFFDKEALAFFGERISKMKYNGMQVITDASGHKRKCHVLRAIQNDSVLGTRWALHFFDSEDFDQVIPDFDMTYCGKWVKGK